MAYDSTWREAPKTAIIRVVGATALGIALLLGLWAGLKPASVSSQLRRLPGDHVGSAKDRCLPIPDHQPTFPKTGRCG